MCMTKRLYAFAAADCTGSKNIKAACRVNEINMMSMATPCSQYPS
jgi:hypothetical protein